VIVAFNRDGAEKKLTLPLDAMGFRDGAELSPLIGTSVRSRVANGQAILNIPPKTAVVYIAR